MFRYYIFYVSVDRFQTDHILYGGVINATFYLHWSETFITWYYDMYLTLITYIFLKVDIGKQFVLRSYYYVQILFAIATKTS